MNFDPTYNYGNCDLTVEKNVVYWEFGELIKNLITLSADAARQSEIIGFGNVCEEMANDFDTYLSSFFQTYIDTGLLTEKQAEGLKQLNSFFDERNEDNSPGFWDDSMLGASTEWEIVRQKARSLLILLGLQDFTIEFDREEKHETTNKGVPVIIQSTKTRLVRYNAK